MYGLFLFRLTDCVCSVLGDVRTSVCACAGVLLEFVCGVCRQGAQAFRMTFGETWRRERKHLTHN